MPGAFGEIVEWVEADGRQPTPIGFASHPGQCYNGICVDAWRRGAALLRPYELQVDQLTQADGIVNLACWLVGNYALNAC